MIPAEPTATRLIRQPIRPGWARAPFLTVARFFAIWVDRGARQLLVKQARLDPAVAGVLARTIRIAIWVLAGVAVLEELGVEVASLIAALGIFGFAIAIGQRLSASLRDNLAVAGVEVHSVGVAKKARKTKKKASPAADDDD